MNFRNFHTSNNSTSSSTSTDSTSDMEWTKEESLRKAAGAKSSPSKRTKNKLKAPGNLKRKRKVKKAKKNTAKKELKTLLPLAELSSTEPKSPDSSPNSLDLSTSETPHSLDKKDQIRNYYNDTKIMLRDMDANVLWQCTSKPVEQRDGSDEEQPSGSHEAGTSEQVDKPKLKSVIIRKNPNYYIKKAPDTSSDDSG